MVITEHDRNKPQCQMLNEEKVGKNGAMLLTHSLKIPQKTLHWRLGF